MSVNITVTVECDVCHDTGDMVASKNKTSGRAAARRCGWSSSGDRDRCPDCKESGLKYPEGTP